MRSYASYTGHPIHPALIPFPFAFLPGALLFDVAGLLSDRRGLMLTGRHLSVLGLAAVCCGPATQKIQTYETREQNGSVAIVLPG